MPRYANSMDSHVLEPHSLWQENLPPSLRDRGLKVTHEGEQEVVIIDGVDVRRDPLDLVPSMRAGGHGDPEKRIQDLDYQGVWAEVLFPSLGIWLPLCPDAELQMEMHRIYNDWLHDTFLRYSERYVGAASIGVADIDKAVAEVERTAAMGFKAVQIPTSAPPERQWNDDAYEPLWAAVSAAGMVLCSHVGSGSDPVVARGPGGALVNWVETFFPAQRLVSYLVAAGVLDRYRDLHFVAVEGGASWIASLMERLDEGFRQHGRWVRPALSAPPSEIIRRQVHASFQHDRAHVRTLDYTGIEAIMWGSDYPHLEGTWPNTRDEIDKVFEGVDPQIRDTITHGNFERLFPVPAPPEGFYETEAEPAAIG